MLCHARCVNFAPLRCQIFLIFEMFAVACGGLECKRDNKMV